MLQTVLVCSEPLIMIIMHLVCTAPFIHIESQSAKALKTYNKENNKMKKPPDGEHILVERFRY